MHTPSTPKIQSPASATDPRFSTSGILNAHIKEQNRQGLLSTYGGRTGQAMNINKFAEKKIAMRDPGMTSALEHLASLYGAARTKSQAAGVGNAKTSSQSKANRNINAYNESVDAVNSYLNSYNAGESDLVKGTSAKDYEKRKGTQPWLGKYQGKVDPVGSALFGNKNVWHDANYGASNKQDINASVSSAGKTGDAFNAIQKTKK